MNLIISYCIDTTILIFFYKVDILISINIKLNIIPMKKKFLLYKWKSLIENQ